MTEANKEEFPAEEMPAIRKEMSRRQFLSYTLGGTGAFLITLPFVVNLRFAVDPLLQERAGSEWVKVVEADKITETPQSFSFQKRVVDGWYESEPKMEAWIARDENGEIFALSPICKHLGCTVNWNGSPNHPNEYYCPCHGAHYTKEGKALAIAPEPLDEYEVMIDNGFVYLGNLKPNERV